MAQKQCPECGSEHIHRSHVRNLWERAQKGFTTNRLFRCHDCGWRGWLETGARRRPARGPNYMTPGTFIVAVAAALVVAILIIMGKLSR